MKSLLIKPYLLHSKDNPVKEFQQSLDKALKSGKTSGCNTGCDCKH